MPVIVTTKRFNAGQELNKLTQDVQDTGAVVSFTGLCRNESGSISTLTLECYEEMAKAELEDLERQALARWPLQGSLIIHRYGEMHAGDEIVFVATLSKHRKAAFEAAEFLMDFLKTQAPFWKLEKRGEEAKWVEAKEEDDKARERW
jgi:molybdopterin synthase catalytic subunit